MSDQLKTLLQAYDADVTNESVYGNTLSFIKSHFLIVQPEILPPDFSAPLPCLLIYPLTIPSRLLCLGIPYVYEKNYQIGMTLIQESFGEAFGLMGQSGYPGIIDNLEALETQYHQNTLDVTNGCMLVSVDYQIRKIPPFLYDGIIQGTMVLQHIYEDMKAV